MISGLQFTNRVEFLLTHKAKYARLICEFHKRDMKDFEKRGTDLCFAINAKKVGFKTKIQVSVVTKKSPLETHSEKEMMSSSTPQR